MTTAFSVTKKERPLVVIAGPTACGKSGTAVELARRIGGEVISADSMQVYRYMDIGSAKVTLEEMMGIPHHMIDVADPTEAFDVSRYAREATQAIEGVLENGHIPILCGGTGFYIQAAAYAVDFEETSADPALREELNHLADTEGNAALFEKLKALDPFSASLIHPNNRKRVIRALEYFEETGRSIASHNEETRESKASPYDLRFYVLTDDRQALYDRIDRRVDFMVEEGLFDEVAYLKAMGLTRDMVSMQGIGYKEILDYYDGLITRDEAIRQIKLGSRHYAKRQLTWFKREPDAVWIDIRDYDRSDIKLADHLAEELACGFQAVQP